MVPLRANEHYRITLQCGGRVHVFAGWSRRRQGITFWCYAMDPPQGWEPLEAAELCFFFWDSSIASSQKWRSARMIHVCQWNSWGGLNICDWHDWFRCFFPSEWFKHETINLAVDHRTIRGDGSHPQVRLGGSHFQHYLWMWEVKC